MGVACLALGRHMAMTDGDRPHLCDAAHAGWEGRSLRPGGQPFLCPSPQAYPNQLPRGAPAAEPHSWDTGLEEGPVAESRGVTGAPPSKEKCSRRHYDNDHTPSRARKPWC